MNRIRVDIKKAAIFITILLLSLAIIVPFSQSQSMKNISRNIVILKNLYKQTISNPRPTTLGKRDFSIVLHRIKKEDSIDPAKGSANWKLRMYVNGERKTYECDKDDIIIDKIITWEDIITDDLTYLEIKFELQEKDFGYWPDEHDIADISAHAGGGADDTTNFDKYRGAVFIRTYNIKERDWEPVDENNDYLKIDDQSELQWFITSGNFDGSTSKDENDATIWFNVFIENRAPYAPEKPYGPTKGEINVSYTFSTKCEDPDGDEVQFGWDWNGDNEIDELTDYYNSWETASVSHTWYEPGIYYVKVIAIDEQGMISEWSESIIVEINGPGGKSGFKVEKWAFGHVYTLYLNHEETQELVRLIRKGGNVVTLIVALIVAIAAAAGIPLDITTAAKIAYALIRLGAATIDMMDRGRGVYFKVYVVEICGVPVYSFAYIWSQ
jgi:hypothetical protein